MELGYSHDLAKKNAKLTIGYGFTRNYVGRAHDPNFEKLLDIQGAQIGLSQILDKKTLLTIAYTLSYAGGYQGSPYRFITLMDGFAAPESPPEARTRHALTGRRRVSVLRRRLGNSLAHRRARVHARAHARVVAAVSRTRVPPESRHVL